MISFLLTKQFYFIKFRTMKIRGIVTVFSHEVAAGLIHGEDLKTYPFAARDWLGDLDPKQGIEVTFIDNPEAKEVRPVGQTKSAQ